jgi:hypothetical protein
MAAAILFEINFDKGLAHEIGGKGSVIFLALALLVGFFRFVVKTSVPKVTKKEGTSILKLMVIFLSVSVSLAIIWAFTANTDRAEDATVATDPSQIDYDSDFRNSNSSNPNFSRPMPIISSNVNVSSVNNSNNTINSNKIINSNVNSPTTNIYNRQYNSTLIQPVNNSASRLVPHNEQLSSRARVGTSISTYPQSQQFTPAVSPTKQNDPELIRLVRQLRDLRKRGLREANPDTAYASVRDCLAAFNSWRYECLALLKQADRIIEERYKEESFSYSTFERDSKMPDEVLQVRDGISSCKRLYLTFAESLNNYIPRL